MQGTLLITGGAGFLGRGILRRAQQEGWDARFVVYSRDEQKHYALHQRYPEVRCVIGDVLDTQRLHLLMSTCDYVIHTAAIKYIPECERQPSEAIRVNIDGTRSVMDAARAAGIKRTVIISTDKAAGPVNTYGMTKALTERMVFESVELPAPSGASFVACRYGNVIGSTGSIWPVFKQQFERDKTLQVTNPDMTRFYISINDAVDIIQQALNAPAGTVLVPQPQALKLGALADYVTGIWNAHNYRVVGARPGEKLHECMLTHAEAQRIQHWGDYWVLHGPAASRPSPRVAMHGAVTSDLVERMEPSDFVAEALDSEAV